MRALGRWTLIAIPCVLVASLGFVAFGWFGWTASWFGTIFKAASGGALGWAISRYALKLNLSEIPPATRAAAAVSQAILIAGFAIAVAFGA
jgi:hypothetical protein